MRARSERLLFERRGQLEASRASQAAMLAQVEASRQAQAAEAAREAELAAELEAEQRELDETR